MCAADPRAKDTKKEERPDSTGKVYEQIVEDLFMGSTSEEEEEKDDSE